MTWHLYLLECANGFLYAGITNNLEARFKAHQDGTGAKFTRANPPIRMLASREYPNKAEAARAEWEIKQLPRKKKLAYFETAEV